LKKEEIPTLQVVLVREGTFKLKSDMTFEELKKIMNYIEEKTYDQTL